jgi:16S rRNA (guanine527-N7)-methyltransferase
VESEASLLEVLAGAQAQGFLGPGDPRAHLTHAKGFVEAALSQLGEPPAAFADLGTGGGVPGLVLALCWPEARGSLVESSTRRCAVLLESIRRLGLDDRVDVVEGRAERLGHDPALREQFDLVTARSFARPAVTAEVAVGFVRKGGLVVVSEPPEPAPERWPDAPLDELGFGPMIAVEAEGAHYACFRKIRKAAQTMPRPVGRAGKKPLW